MFNALRQLLTSEIPANKVQEVKTDAIASLQVLHRDDSMVLYAPVLNPADTRKNVYEIILHRPCSESVSTCYSLYRSPVQSEVEEKFQAFSHRIPDFVLMAKEYYNVQGLQKICDVLSEHPSYSLAHLVAHFNLTEYLSNPKVIETIDYPDHQDYRTPLMTAVKCKNIDVVKILLLNVKLDHLDNNSDSIFHYAANTTKEMVNLIASKSTVNLNHCNLDGYTPLHLACLSDNPECVKSLLLAGAEVNITARQMTNVYNKNKSPSNNEESSPNRSIAGSVAEFLQIQKNSDKLLKEDMKYGGTPLHWCSSKEVLEALIQRGCDVNALNFDGRTALHMMVERNRLECVVCLLAHECESDVKDKDGNTPLLIAVKNKFVPIVQCLVCFGCDINLKNKDGKSPRHLVGKDANGSKDDILLYILHSVGAKRCPESSTKCPPGCNPKGTYNGIPPPVQLETPDQREHIQEVLAASVGRGRNSIPQLLNQQLQMRKEKPTLIDVSDEQKGQSVMDTLLGIFSRSIQAAAKKESPTSEKATSTQDDDIDSINMNMSNNNEEDMDVESEEGVKYGRGRLLCLDGGGIRGLVLVQMLLEIETLSQTPIHHLFDWVAGTSTGGILALGLGVGKTMKQCMCLYLRMKDVAFVGSRPYPSDPLESVLKENLGEYTTMADIKNPKIMVTGLMCDRKPVDLHLFRNYKSASDILGIVTPTSNRRVCAPEEQLIWRAARATGAAPSYFRAFGRFLDGGLISNNPTLDAMTEIHEYNMALRSKNRKKEAVPLSVIVSLGTGLVPVTELKEIDVFRPDSIWDTAKLAYGISAIGNLLVDQATLADGRVVDRARAWCSMVGIPYFRFNPQMSVDMPMDEKMDEPLINMMWETKAYMYQNRNRVIEMINLLK